PLYLLARLRDEAHRFAITFHRQTRRKKRLGSALDTIDGIGPKRRKALLTHFGSLKRVTAATPAEIAEVSGIKTELAARIHTALHPPELPATEAG
ncbi:MAG: excinuclease ABC subunit C, partial [Myxococcota bacterium]